MRAPTAASPALAALDAVELVPRYGITTTLPPVDVELFGKRYSAPIGVAPMGGPSLVWPGADQYLAAAAQRARVPYTLGLVGGMTVERAAEIAPDVLWFQLYRCSRNDHAIGFDLLRRAETVGVHGLVLTLTFRCAPHGRARSPSALPRRSDRALRMIAGIVSSPGYLKSLWMHGQPRFANLKPYRPTPPTWTRSPHSSDVKWAAPSPGTRLHAIASAGSVPWWWKEFSIPPMLKNASRSGSMASSSPTMGGAGRGLPAPIDVLPAIARAVGGRATVMLDSGVRSGLDVVRAVALGADAAFAGKAFLWGLGALGAEGPGHVIDLMIDEMRSSVGQMGAFRLNELRSLDIRHKNAFDFEAREVSK